MSLAARPAQACQGKKVPDSQANAESSSQRRRLMPPDPQVTSEASAKFGRFIELESDNPSSEAQSKLKT